ncbi:putative BNA1-3-hydroxyanthranilic acid dioxygenase [Atractiella rhizophila]|nr:putative BNA1-3-hydroxyanthranilic acid dioxygenase [Atractiella rhizophila]
MLPPPIDFVKWYEENSHLLAPPVNNYCLYESDDYTVMAVGGPNQRNDFHINQTDEWFYQYKGDMLLKIVEDGKIRDIPIKEGAMFMLPHDTPHNPVRFANTVGFVIERRRPADTKDRLRWYCTEEVHDKPVVIREVAFHVTDLGKQLKAPINEWRTTESLRKCPECGKIADAQ